MNKLAKVIKVESGVAETKIRDIKWEVGKKFIPLAYVNWTRTDNVNAGAFFDQKQKCYVNIRTLTILKAINKDYLNALLRAWINAGLEAYEKHQEIAYSSDIEPTETKRVRDMTWDLETGFTATAMGNPVVPYKDLTVAITVEVWEKLRKINVNYKGALIRAWIAKGLEDWARLKEDFVDQI